MDEKKVLICSGGTATVEDNEGVAKTIIRIEKDVWGKNGVFVVNVTGCSESRILMFACWYAADYARGHAERFADYIKRNSNSLRAELVGTTKENWWDELKGVEK